MKTEEETKTLTSLLEELSDAETINDLMKQVSHIKTIKHKFLTEILLLQNKDAVHNYLGSLIPRFAPVFNQTHVLLWCAKRLFKKQKNAEIGNIDNLEAAIEWICRYPDKFFTGEDLLKITDKKLENAESLINKTNSQRSKDAINVLQKKMSGDIPSATDEHLTRVEEQKTSLPVRRLFYARLATLGCIAGGIALLAWIAYKAKFFERLPQVSWSFPSFLKKGMESSAGTVRTLSPPCCRPPKM